MPEWKSRTSSATIRRLVVAGRFAAMVIDEINGPLEAVYNLNYLIARTPEDDLYETNQPPQTAQG